MLTPKTSQAFAQEKFSLQKIFGVHSTGSVSPSPSSNWETFPLQQENISPSYRKMFLPITGKCFPSNRKMFVHSPSDRKMCPPPTGKPFPLQDRNISPSDREKFPSPTGKYFPPPCHGVIFQPPKRAPLLLFLLNAERQTKKKNKVNF